MGIADFFRPKYRHSDVRVRIEAVSALSSDDAAILKTVAQNDRDAQVRCIAIRKIEEAELLAELAASERERECADLAGERAAELWLHHACGTDEARAHDALAGLLRLGQQRAMADVVARAQLPSIAKRAFAEIAEPKALADLTRHQGVALDQKLAAVARIDDADVLRALATDTNQKEVGLAAVERLDDHDRLMAVANKAKNKAVRAAARKVVNEMESAEKAAAAPQAVVISDDVKRRRAEKAQLLRRAEQVIESAAPSIDTELAELRAAFFALQADAGDAADEKFARLLKRYEMRVAAVQSKAEAERHSQQLEVERRAALAARAAEARAAEAAQEIVRTPVVDPAEEQRRAARKAEAEARRAEREAQKAAEDAKRQALAAERAARDKAKRERDKAAVATLADLVRQLEDAVAGKKVDAAHAESALVEPNPEPAHESAVGAAPDVKRRRAKVPAAERLLELAAKAYGEAARAPEAERAALETRYHAARAQLVLQVGDKREAEDWQRWNNVPQAESLIAVAKELLSVELVAQASADGAKTANEVGGLLKELQQAWKEVGPLPQKKSKELWDTFKTTCDQVYDRIRGQRAVAAERYVEVTAAKEALIAQAEALAASEEWGPTADKLKALQAEWKKSGYLPRAQADELWNRFRTACDGFFARRKQQGDEKRAQELVNLERKKALIARVRQVVDAAPGEGGWGRSIAKVRDAQAEWKTIGYVPKKDADSIWAEFRAACDELFAKRDEARDAEENAGQIAEDGAFAAIAAVLQLDGATPAEVLAQAQQARQLALDVLADAPDSPVALQLDALHRHVVAHAGDALSGSEFDPSKAKARRLALVENAKQYLPKAEPTVDASAGDVAAQLAAAMKQNAFGALRFSGRTPEEVVVSLREQFRSAGPMLDEQDQQVAQALEAVLRKVAPDAPGVPVTQPLVVAERKPRAPRSARAPRRQREPVEVLAEGSAPTAATASHAASVAAEGQPETASASVQVKSIEATPASQAAGESALPAVRPSEPQLGATTRKRAMSEPPPMDEVDTAWDLDDHRPVAREAAPNPPGAAELAGDGVVEGDGLDGGWD